jgi:hypothetical protein
MNSFFEKKIICFVNVETDPRLWYSIDALGGLAHLSPNKGGWICRNAKVVLTQNVERQDYYLLLFNLGVCWFE